MSFVNPVTRPSPLAIGTTPSAARPTVGIDVSRANVTKRTGVEWYAWHLIQEFKTLIPPEVRVLLYSREPLLPDFGPLPANWEVKVLAWPPKRMWTQVRLSWEMLVRPPDALFVPVHAMPLLLPKRRITTLHDVAFVVWPKAYSRFERWYQRFAVRHASRRADAILTISEFSRSELLRHFSVPDRKITVTPLGCDAADFTLPSPEAIDEALKKAGVRRPYFLFVGRIERKKNVAGLLRAYKRYRTSVSSPIGLVMVGKPGFGGEEALALLAADQVLSGSVQLLGYVGREDLRALYAGAAAFVFPSWYEGFGLPVLEAMAAGVPVIAAESSSLPEVCGDAALLVPPDDEAGWAEAMRHVAEVEELQQRLKKIGQLRVQRFTWQATAERTWEKIAELL